MTLRSSLAPRARSAAFILSTAAGIVFVPSALLASEAAFAQSAPSTAKTPYDATLASEALVRCASSTETGYVFGSIPAGTSVRVLQEEPGWVRIATTGSAFDGWFGYVKSSAGVTLSADGKTINIASRAEIAAPNADRDFAPDASYRAIGYLLAGSSANVLESVKDANGTTYYAIALGNGTSGWIASSALTKPATTDPAPTTTTGPKNDAGGSTGANTGGSTASNTEKVVDVKSETAVVEVDTETGQVVAAETTSATATENGAGKPTDAAAANDSTTTTRSNVEAQVKRIRVADLEASYKSMRSEPTELAEFEALRARVLAIAEDPKSTTGEIQRAKFLAKKVDIDLAIQKDLREIAERKRKLDANFKGVADLEMATLARMPYDNVGRLNASKFYTGERMPLLYVLQDPGTGYTIAYIVPDGTYDLSSMLGLVVGVKGPVKYDESLRLNVITPNSIVPITPKPGNDSMTATGAETTQPADK